MLALNLVCNLAGIDEFVHAALYGLCALGNLLNQLEVAFRELVSLVGRIDAAHVLNVLHEHRLIVGGDRNDMVHGEVAHHASLNLNLLRVCLPLHLVSCLKFLL